MQPDKILYVDDEPMALKYFERLVGPLAPVLTARSVAEGKELLAARAGEIAVLVSDQRMPGEHGNELLRYARERHPHVVRMLTTAYSELGEAIVAINAGEIYRYITKPWDLEAMRADLKNALELAELRHERNALVREKMVVLQRQLLASRVAQLAQAGDCAAASSAGAGWQPGLQAFLAAAVQAGCRAPIVDWGHLDHAQLMQAEAGRGIVIAQQAARLVAALGLDRSPAAACAALLQALPGIAAAQGDAVLVTEGAVFSGLLDADATAEPAPAPLGWFAWLLWWNAGVRVEAAGAVWRVTPVAGSPALRPDWLAGGIEQLLDRAQ